MSFHYEKGWRCCFFETDRDVPPCHAMHSSTAMKTCLSSFNAQAE
jgi:hypothetical protein